MMAWQDLLEDVTTKIKKSKGFPKFSKIRSNEEKIEFCLKDEYIRCKIVKWLQVMMSSRHKKYWEKAAELRTEGNFCFQRKDYTKAVEFYTQSILCSPHSSSSERGDELSLAYGNRSAALYYMGKYQACLQDIQRALDHSYPQDLRFKLYFRQCQCFERVGPKEMAAKAVEEAAFHLKTAKLDAKKSERYLKELEDLKARITSPNYSFEASLQKEDPIPHVSYEPHPKLVYASSAVEVNESDLKGRFTVAKQAIRAGDVLFVERPNASVLLPHHYSRHCHNCYVQIDAAIPCRQCTQVRYCSSSCVRDSWKRYHKWECGKLDLLHSLGIAHLTLRLMLNTTLPTLLDFYSKKANGLMASVPAGYSEDGCYRNSYCAVYNLVTHSDDMNVEDTLQYTLTATLLLFLLDKIGFIAEKCEDPMKETMHSALEQVNMSATHNSAATNGEENHNRGLQSHPESLRLYLGGLLLRHIQQLVCNAHAITELQTITDTAASANGGGVVSQKQVRVATALFPTVSLMNHSCDPNIISSFHKDVLIVRAIKDIAVGEEIFNCYGPHFQRTVREERRKLLIQQYFFHCRCQACEDEDAREERFQGLKCSFCEGPLRMPDNSSSSVCLDCGHDQDCLKQLQKVFAAHDLFVQGLQLTAKGNYKDALDKLRRCLKLRQKSMYKFHKQLAEVQDQIACCYASLGEYCLAAEYLRPTLAATEATFGSNSIEMANELQKFSDILMNCIVQLAQERAGPGSEIQDVAKEADIVMDRAEKIFKIHYGSTHQSTKELLVKREQLSGMFQSEK